MLRRFADSITLVLDGDEAGQHRANEILGLFVAEQIDLRIVTLPDDLDPADFLLTRGAEAFRQFLDSAVDALEHKLNRLMQNMGSRATMHQVNQALEQMLSTLAAAPRLQSGTTAQARLREHQILSQLARQFRVSEEELRLRLRDLRRRAKPGSAARDVGPNDEEVPVLSPLSAWERELLEIVLLEPEAVIAAAEEISPEQIETPAAALIFNRCCELSRGGITPTFDRLLLEFDDPAIKNLLVDLDEQGRAKLLDEAGNIKESAEPAARMRDLLNGMRRARQNKSMDEQSQLLREKRLDDAEELAVLNQLIEQERTRQGIQSPMEG